MNKLLCTLIVAATGLVAFDASAASHAGAPMKAASEPAAMASAPAKHAKQAHKKGAKIATSAVSK